MFFVCCRRKSMTMLHCGSMKDISLIHVVWLTAKEIFADRWEKNRSTQVALCTTASFALRVRCTHCPTHQCSLLVESSLSFSLFFLSVLRQLWREDKVVYSCTRIVCRSNVRIPKSSFEKRLTFFDPRRDSSRCASWYGNREIAYYKRLSKTSKKDSKLS